MVSSASDKVAQLLNQAEEYGIQLYYDDKVVIRIPAEQQIDPGFLSELKKHKEELTNYFVTLNSNKYTEHPGADNKKVLNEESSYDVTPAQKWWVDQIPSVDFAIKLIHLRIEGNFSIPILKKTIFYLVSRHESLRSTFHKIDGDYAMKVLPAADPIFEVHYKDMRDIATDEEAIKSFSCFKDHTFNLQKGPLFLVRLVQDGDNLFLLSFKLHHIIYDAWSLDIFYRDLIVTYFSLAEGKESVLPPLKYQYRDFNRAANLFQKEYYDIHKKYWRSIYNSLPEELILPGEKKEKSPNEDTESTRHVSFLISKRTRELLTKLSGKYATSLFIILQALFKSYLFHEWKKNDIVIGTLVFGREEMGEGIEDQIGLYAQMSLIRTVFADGESFEDCLKKVIKSNDDMRKYRAHGLLPLFQDMASPDPHPVIDSFWKIVIRYNDFKSYIDRYELDPVSPDSMFNAYPINLIDSKIQHLDKIQLEFNDLNDQIEAMIAYNSNIYDSEVMRDFFENYSTYLQNTIQSLGLVGYNMIN